MSEFEICSKWLEKNKHIWKIVKSDEVICIFEYEQKELFPRYVKAFRVGKNESGYWFSFGKENMFSHFNARQGGLNVTDIEENFATLDDVLVRIGEFFKKEYTYL